MELYPRESVQTPHSAGVDAVVEEDGAVVVDDDDEMIPAVLLLQHPKLISPQTRFPNHRSLTSSETCS